MTAPPLIRRPPGGGHFLLGLSHYPLLLIAVLVVIVALAYLSHRR